jgi:hypothetical protein
MHSSHGFFFNLDTKILFTFTQYTINQYLHNVQAIINRTPCRNKKNPNLLGGPVSCHGGELPSPLVPCLVATAPLFTLTPFTPFPPPQPTLHYLQ